MSANTTSKNVPNKPNLIIVGFDSEFNRVSEQSEHNLPVSYQWYGIKDRNSHWSGILYPDENNTRITLENLIKEIILSGKRAGVLQELPRTIILVAHHSVADLTMLANYSTLKRYLDCVQKTQVTSIKSMLFPIRSDSFNHDIHIHIRDTLLLVPQGDSKSLQNLGNLLGIPKIKLPPGCIENMKGFLESDRELFEKYALRDAEIAAKYFVHICIFYDRHVGANGIPLSLAGMSEKFALGLLKNQGINRHELAGTHKVAGKVWNENTRKTYRAITVEPLPERQLIEGYATLSYYGGRNETFIYGETPRGRYLDWDLCSAYTTAIAMCGVPDYANARMSRDLNDFDPETLGFAHVEFEFPESTRFPTIPIRCENSLIFPLKGESIIPAPEIYLARKLNAEIKIKAGLIVPWRKDIVKPFEELIRFIQTQRAAQQKGSLEEKIWKEIGNSIYGKISQAVKKKTVFNSRTGTSGSVNPSNLTNPFLASYVTSFIRAVLGEILNAIPNDRMVVSVTTDGFLSDATDEEIMQATQGVLCNKFSQMRSAILGTSDRAQILDVKHGAAKILAWRTRGQATLEKLDGFRIVLAKGGVRPPVKGEDEENAWMIQAFYTRTAESKYIMTPLRSVREVCENGIDVVSYQREVTLNMDYDFKRKPDQFYCLEEEDGIARFTTSPWNTTDDYIAAVQAHEKFFHEGKRVLKEVTDFDEFSGYLAMRKCSRREGKRVYAPKSASGPIEAAIRQFLRALIRGEWGLSTTMKYKEISEWLENGGFHCSVNMIKNQKRPERKQEEHVVPRTDDTIRFSEYVLEKFPEFRAELMFESLRG